MSDISLGRTIPFPSSLPSAPGRILALQDALEERHKGLSPYEQDAFSYSGRPSHALDQSPPAGLPKVTPVHPVDVREHELPHITYEGATTMVSNVASAMTHVASAAAPAAIALTMMRPGKKEG